MNIPFLLLKARLQSKFDSWAKMLGHPVAKKPGKRQKNSASHGWLLAWLKGVASHMKNSYIVVSELVFFFHDFNCQNEYRMFVGALLLLSFVVYCF